MKKTSRFLDVLDCISMIAREKKEQLGEDSYFCSDCSDGNHSAIISVFDGCGGAGSKKYPNTYANHSGAYMASRTLSGAVCDWYKENKAIEWLDGERLRDSLEKKIRAYLELINQHKDDDSGRIRSKLIRPFPSTMVLAYIHLNNNKTEAHILWAGDSRAYLLTGKGLQQLTKDDTNAYDALDNITNDAPMTNVVSADMNFVIHEKTILLNEPALLIVATDGCFGYIPSPMEFEYTIVKHLADEKSMIAVEKELYEEFRKVAQDDFSFSMTSLGFGTFDRMSRSFTGRKKELEFQYIDKIQKCMDSYGEEDEMNPSDTDKMEELRKSLWEKYRSFYEEYMMI